MANQEEIANLALSQVKGNFIESFTEGSRESTVLLRVYEIARDAALADVSPEWARKQAVLAESTQTVTGYDFVYAYPVDCLADLEIYNPAKVNQEDTIEYKLGINSAGNGKLILTDEEAAELIYIFKVTNTGVYDQLFVEALAWKLAAYLAIPLKGDQQLQAACSQAYRAAVSNAKAFTRNRGYKKPDNSNSFTAARL